MLKKQTKSKALFTLILAMVVLVYACRKDLMKGGSSTKLDDPAYRMNIDLARKVYNDLKKEKGALVKPRKANTSGLAALSKASIPENHNNRRYALFQKAYESETAKSTFVEIPIVYNQRFSMTVINPKTFAKTSALERQLVFRYSFDRFLVYKDKTTGKISHRMLTYIPGLDYLKKHNYKVKHNQLNKLDSDYSGFIEFKEWDGTGIYLLQYENGKKIRYISLKKTSKQKLVSTESSGMGARGCQIYEIEEWGETCIDAGPESASGEPECTAVLIDIDYVEICDGGGDTGDPCADYGECGTGDPCIDYGDCGGGGDPGTPIDPNPQPSVTLAPIIVVDPAARPCVTDIVNSIVDASKLTGTLVDMLKVSNVSATNAQNAVYFLSNVGTFTFGITEGTIPPTQVEVDGQIIVTNTNGSTNPTTGDITLNTLMLNQATDLAVAATTIHELMHTYLVYGAQHLSGTEKIYFEDVNRYIFDSEDSSVIPPGRRLSDAQHYQMAETYLNSMAGLLQSYAIQKGITTSPNSSISLLDYCKDIFWSSLGDSSGLTPPNKTRAQNNAKKEYENKSGSSGKKGC